MKLTKKQYEGICDRVEKDEASDEDHRLFGFYGGRAYLEGKKDGQDDASEPSTPDGPPCPHDGGADDTPPVKENEPEAPKDDKPLSLRPTLG